MKMPLLLTFLCFSSSVILGNGLGEISDVFNLSLEELTKVRVYTASKTSERVEDAPGIITYVTAGEIKRFGARSLKDILERITSFYPTGSNFFPDNVMAVRGDLLGHYDNHLLLLINSRPLREGYANGLDFSFYKAFPVDLIERIEIIRGPGSVLYGTNAYAAVINVITREADESGAKLLLTGGSFGTGDVSFSAQTKARGWDLLAGVRFLDSDGWQLQAKDNQGDMGQRLMNEQNHGIFISVRNGKLELNAFSTQSDSGFIGGVVDWQGLPPIQERDMMGRRSMIDFGYKFGQGSSRETKFNLSFSEMRFDHYNYAGTSEDLFLEMSQLWRMKEDLHVLYGLTAWHQNVGSEEGLREAPVQNFTALWLNAFGEITWQANERTKLFLGGQANKPEGIDVDFSSRFGGIFKLAKAFNVKLLYSEAFRSAFGVETGFNLILTNPDGSIRGGLRGNPNLGPEEIRTIEAELSYTGKTFMGSLVFYDSQQSNLITRERASDGVVDFMNEGILEMHGIEFESRWTPNECLYLSASFSHQRNRGHHDLEDFTLVPRNMAKVGISYASDRISVGLFDSWFDKAPDVSIRNPERLEINPPAAAHHLLSLEIKAFLDTDRRWSLGLSGRNILDEGVYHPEFIGRRINTLPAAGGRAFYGQLGLRF